MKKYIKILPSGYGHWEVSAEYYGKTVTIVTNDAAAIDDYKCNDDEKCWRDHRTLRKNRGYKRLMSLIAHAAKSKVF